MGLGVTLRWSARDVLRLQALAPNTTVINMYGTTETQRSVSYLKVPPAPHRPGPRCGGGATGWSTDPPPQGHVCLDHGGGGGLLGVRTSPPSPPALGAMTIVE